MKYWISSPFYFNLKMFLRQLINAAWGFSEDQIGKQYIW